MENTQDKRKERTYRKWIGTRRQIIVKAVFSLVYTLFIMLGEPERWRKLLDNPVWLLVLEMLGTALAAYAVLTVLFLVLDRRKTRELPVEERERRFFDGRTYLVLAIVCLLCWLPYFLTEYPGWVSNDSVWQLEQICGMKPLSNHHPFLHTMLIKLFFTIGQSVSGTVEGGVALYIFAQMVFMTLVYALIVYDLYKKNVHNIWLVAALLFYAVLPVNGVYAIGMGKDTLFAGMLLLFARYVYRYSTGKESCLGIAVTGLLVCMLRSNGILVFAGTAAGLVIAGFLRKKQKRIVTCCVLVLACYLVYQGPLLRALAVQQPDVIEGLTMPVQQMLSAYVNGGTLTQEQTEYLAEIVPLEGLEKYYNASFFDLVKNHIREQGNQQVIADDKGRFLKMWLEIGLHHPAQYLEAEIRQTYGYWGFHVDTPLYEQYRMAENPFGLTVQRKVFSYDFSLWESDFLMRFQDAFPKVWSLGLTTWLLLLCMAYALYAGKSVLPYLPFAMLFVSLLLATPVYAEFRYTYGIFVAIPLLLWVTLEPRKDGAWTGQQEQEAV